MKFFAPSLAVLTMLTLAGCATGQADMIKEKLDTLNYCSTAEDCTVLRGDCPFDCYVAVNFARVPMAERLMNGYDSNCTYSCLPQPEVACVDWKCVFPDAPSHVRTSPPSGTP